MKKLIASLVILAASAGCVNAKTMAQEAAQEAAANIELAVGPSFGASAVNMKPGTSCELQVTLEGGYVKDMEIKNGNLDFCTIVTAKINELGHVGGMSATPYAFIATYSVYDDNFNTSEENEFANSPAVVAAEQQANTPTPKPAPELPEIKGSTYTCTNGEKAIVSTDKKALRIFLSDETLDLHISKNKYSEANETDYANADTGVQVFQDDAKSMMINFGHGYDTDCELVK